MIKENEKLMVLDIPNKNNRIYTTQAVHDALTRLPKIVVGEFGPSDGAQAIDLGKVSHRVDNLRIEDGYLVGDVTTMKTPMGIELDEILDKVDFRPRIAATAMLGEEGVLTITDLTIISIDAVMDGHKMAGNEPKQVLIVRKDLNMRKGKIAAQSAHASLKAILDLGRYEKDRVTIPLDNSAVREWLEQRFTKICVSVDSEQELVEIYQQAVKAGIVCSIITDAGLTEFGGVPTKTVVAIGPAYPNEVDPITGHLKLL